MAMVAEFIGIGVILATCVLGALLLAVALSDWYDR